VIRPGLFALAMQKPCKLNAFQQAMALWEEAHPYNAGQVVHLRGRADVAVLQAAVQAACQASGVGRLVLDRRKGRYHYEPVESVALREIESRGHVTETLCRVISEELNIRFPDEPHHPVRWLVLDDAKTESHFLVAIYQHLAADSFAMRLLMRRVLNRYCNTILPEEEKSLRVHAPAYSRVMRHHFRQTGYLTTFVRMVQDFLRLRYVHRIRDLGNAGEESRSLILQAPEGFVSQLVVGCRSRGVTVNDAFLAALFGAIAEMTLPHRRHGRRRGLALATVVDVREAASENLSDCFGLYLGQIVTTIDKPDDAGFPELLIRTAEHMRREKGEKRFIGPQWNLAIVSALGRWFSVNVARDRYRKAYPLSAGMSNVRLDSAWFRGASDRILDYIRISPTGPALSLIFTPTTYGDRLNLSITYRESSFSEGEILKLVDRFFHTLESIVASGHAVSCGYP
jgi:NRPS condensation-like uncharacterized protein